VLLLNMSARLAILSVMLLTLTTQAADLSIQPLVKPGYAPGTDARGDEQGIWMEMEEAELELRRSPLLIRDTVVSDLVESTACQVAGEYCDDLRVYVVRNPTFNASMAPNGAMIVHTGLLVRAASIDQLSAVLGHELAHFTQTHSLKRLRAAKVRMTTGAVFSMMFAGAGINTGGLPEILALASVMGFTRDQEREADRLGAYFMSEAGFDPNAAAQIWLMLEEEEEQASVKSPKGPLFLASHPQSERRAANLSELSMQLEPDGSHGIDNDPFIQMLQSNYEMFMDEQVQLRDHGRIQVLLDRHEALGIRPSDIAMYRGEVWRIRGGAGDHERAMEQYEIAISSEVPNVRAFRELAYLEYKHGEQEVAKEHFRRYLELQPDASDREMIKFYLEDGW
jgi:predicted Zn-dependent protease